MRDLLGWDGHERLAEGLLATWAGEITGQPDGEQSLESLCALVAANTHATLALYKIQRLAFEREGWLGRRSG